MIKHLPSTTELAIFATLAVILAGVAVTSGSVGGAMALIACPLFFICALVGMRRSGRFTAAMASDVADEAASTSAVID